MSLEQIWNVVGPQQNRTKAPLHRARTVYNAGIDVINNNIEGDFSEFGTWKGGLTGLMGVLCDNERKGRKVHAFDSFQGMSPADPEKDLIDGETVAKVCFQPRVQLRNFNLNDFQITCFEMLKVKRETINIIEGWAEHTIPANVNKIDKLAILRIDFDWYAPTKLVIEAYYPKLVKGGYIILDDYGCFLGARQAVDEYREKYNITTPLIQTPKDDGTPQPSLLAGTEHYWIKE